MTPSPGAQESFVHSDPYAIENRVVRFGGGWRLPQGWWGRGTKPVPPVWWVWGALAITSPSHHTIRVLLLILRSERNFDRLYLNDAWSVTQTGSASIDQSHQSTRAGSGTCCPTNLLGDSHHHSLKKQLHFTDSETEAPKCPKSTKRDGRHE